MACSVPFLGQQALIGGTQRLFSVKYLFEEVDNRSLEVFIACLDDRSTDMILGFENMMKKGIRKISPL